MDGSRFDSVRKTLGGATSRRDTVRAAVAGVIATTLAALGRGDADARKKKKTCKKPKITCGKKCCAAGLVCRNGKCTAAPPPGDECQFTKSANLWTLEADCTITRTIEIPNGVTFDGNDKTIAMSGAISRFATAIELDGSPTRAGLFANGGNATIQNLAVRASGLTGPIGPSVLVGILFSETFGAIDTVVLRDIKHQDSGAGILVVGAANEQVTLTSVNISETVGGVFFRGPSAGAGSVSGQLLDCTVVVEGSAFDATFVDEITIDACELRSAFQVVSIQKNASATIQNSVIDLTDAQQPGFVWSAIVINFGAATVSGNTITGLATGVAPISGVAYYNGSTGTVDDNDISGFRHGDTESG